MNNFNYKNDQNNQNILILGIGSPFSDDQFGFKVAEYLKKAITNPSVEIQIADRPGLNLLNYLELPYQKIILIDAVNANQTAGRCFYFKASEITQFNGFLSSHNLGIAYALSLFEALGNSLDNIYFYGVQAKYLDQKDEILSKEVLDQIIPTANKVLAEIG